VIILLYTQNVYKLGESKITERDIIQIVVLRLLPKIIIYIYIYLRVIEVFKMFTETLKNCNIYTRIIHDNPATSTRTAG